MTKRVKFDFEIDFTNGGGVQGQDFRLDIDGDDIEDKALTDYIVQVCPASHPGLQGEKWFTGKTALPTEAVNGIRERSQQFDEVCRKAGVRRGPVRSVAICAPRFNGLLDQCGHLR